MRVKRETLLHVKLTDESHLSSTKLSIAHCVMASTKYNARLSFQSELPVEVLERLLVT